MNKNKENNPLKQKVEDNVEDIKKYQEAVKKIADILEETGMTWEVNHQIRLVKKK